MHIYTGLLKSKERVRKCGKGFDRCEVEQGLLQTFRDITK